MEFKEILEIANKRDIGSDLIKEYRDSSRMLSNTEKKLIGKLIEENSLKLKFIPTINFIVFGLICSREFVIDLIKRKGLLRYSKYIDKSKFPEAISKKIISIASDLA